MILRVRYLGGLRDLVTGVRAEEVEVGQPATLADLVQVLTARHPGLDAHLDCLRLAVNENLVTPDHPLGPGDEVALLPPVAGGAGQPEASRCHLTSEPIDVGEVVRAVLSPDNGAVATFTGLVRRHNAGRPVIRLEYEAFRSMAIRSLAEIVQRCERLNQGARVAVTHRTGVLGGRRHRRGHRRRSSPSGRGIRGLPALHRAAKGRDTDLETGNLTRRDLLDRGPVLTTQAPELKAMTYRGGTRLPSIFSNSGVASPGWAELWQRSWDRLEEGLVPDRERRIGVMVDVVEAMVGNSPTVIDLACGPGTIACRLLDRLPQARCIAVDVDPVLLTIASATFADDDRVEIVRADLRDPGWLEALPESRVDAVLTATSLHWLPEATVRRIYGDLAGVVRGGGVVAHSELMPLAELPSLGPALAGIARQRGIASTDARAHWDAWWERASHDPVLQPAVAQRRAVFESTYPTEEFSPPAHWHMATLREAGFAEVGVVLRLGPGAVVAAIR